MVSFHIEAIRLQSQWPFTWKQFNTFQWSKNRPLLEDYVNERAFKLIFLDIFLFFLCATLETIWSLSRFWTSSFWKLVYAVFTILIIPCLNLFLSFCFYCAMAFRTSLPFTSIDLIAFMRLSRFFNPNIHYFLAKEQIKQIISKILLNCSLLPSKEHLTWFLRLINLVLIFYFITNHFSLYYSPTKPVGPICTRVFCSLTYSHSFLSFSFLLGMPEFFFLYIMDKAIHSMESFLVN